MSDCARHGGNAGEQNIHISYPPELTVLENCGYMIPLWVKREGSPEIACNKRIQERPEVNKPRIHSAVINRN